MQKQTYIFLFLILILIAGLNSCTIEKRSYQPGYYVDWHNVNRKSDANPENNSVEQQETASYENKIKKNNVEKIEDFIQPIAIQKIEPVYASNNENINDIEVVNTTDQNSTLTRNPQKHEVIIEDTKVLSGNTGEKEMHWSTKAGFILSILSTSAIIGSFLDGLMLYLFLTLVGYSLAILGVIFSLTSLIIILLNPEKYKGLGLTIASLALPLISLLFILLMTYHW